MPRAPKNIGHSIPRGVSRALLVEAIMEGWGHMACLEPRFLRLLRILGP